MPKDDHLLIKEILAGNKAAQRELYEQHERYWFRLCLRYGRNREEAQDILQEGLIRVFRDLKQFDKGRGAFRSWSNRVMVNAALQYLRKHHWQHSFKDMDVVTSEISLPENILGKITARELTLIIQKLPTGYRTVFNMFEIEGYTHKEIAMTLNISEGTSKSQLFKAKKILRHQLEVLFQ